MKKERITLENPIFANAMTATEAALNALVNKMARKGVREGKVSLSIVLELQPAQITDSETGMVYQAQVPEVSYKATYSIRDSENFSGKGSNDAKRLLIREYDGSWSIARDDDQGSLFEE